MARFSVLFEDRWLRYFLRVVAVAYAYGASVHALNMLSMTGFDWSAAPLKWRMLDVAYLIVDLAATIGLFARRAFGILAFLAGAVSQICLYTVFRTWILDVPAEFAPTADQAAYPTGLARFHFITLGVFAALLVWRRRRSRGPQTGRR